MRVRARAAVAVAATVVLGTCGSGVAIADDLSPKEIYDRAAPGTVHVLGTYGSGSGIIYDAKKGLIVTNAHVVQGEPSLRVAVEDRPPVPARLLGIDPCEDLAVLTFSTPQPDLKELKFGPSKDVALADNVTSLGYPETIEGGQGAQKPVFTTGAVQNPEVKDAVPSPSLPRYPSTIQHSATVNPGNSGGPLLNGKAEVVGVNTLTSMGEVQGQFYAISSDHVRPLLDTLAGGSVKNDPGWSLADLHDPALADYFPPEDAATIQNTQDKLKDVEGMMVVYSLTNTPAAKAKLGTGDVITAMKDTPVASFADVCDVLQSSAPGETIPVEGVYSFTANGKETKFGADWSTDLVVGNR